MYMTQIYSSGDGWRGGSGERLVMAGNLPYKSGDTAWTDGRIIYGWTGRDEPTRQWSYGMEGIPINNPSSGLYMFQSQKSCKKYADAKGWLAFANDSGRNFGISQSSFPYVYDMDVSGDGREWALSGRDAVYTLSTPHLLAWASGGTSKPEGRTTFTATWEETGNITLVKDDDGDASTQTFREGARRVFVVESGEPTERDTPFTITHGGISESRSLKEYADAAMEAFDTAAAEKLGRSAYLDNCVNSMTLRLVDGRIDSAGKLSLYILAEMKGFAFKDMKREGLRGSLVQTFTSSPNGSGRIHYKWEYLVNVSQYPVDYTFCAEFVCCVHLHVEGDESETVFESVSCPGYGSGYSSNWAFMDATNYFGGINHAREGSKSWIETDGDVQTYYSTTCEVDVHDGGPLNLMVFPETWKYTSSPSLVINRRIDGFDAIAEEDSWPFHMPIQDGYYAVISPKPISLSSYGGINYNDMRTYLGCFQRVYSPEGALVVDTALWNRGLLSVRAISPIDENGKAYLVQAVSSTDDWSGQVFTYSREEGEKPVEVNTSDDGYEYVIRMRSTNTRLRRMKNAAALKRRQ